MSFQDHEYMTALEKTSDMLKAGIKRIKSEIPKVKNNDESEKNRQQGNEYFKHKNYTVALEKYTKSLCFAEKDSLEQILAYGNRSALLYQKGYYKECLQDIDRALKGGYPEAKKPQLTDRQQRALKLLPEQKRQLFHDKTPQLNNPNPDIPSMSKSIRFSKNEKFGTFIEAAQDIKLGEVLLVEKPYAFSVQNAFVQKYCSECGELCFNMIPCDECLTLYCSDECKVKAFDLYHQYECVVERYFALNPETIDLPEELEGQTESARKIPVRTTIRALRDLSKEKHKNSMFHSDCYEEIRKLSDHKNNIVKRHAFQLFIQTSVMAKIFYLLTLYTDIKSRFNVDDKTLRGLLFHNSLIHCVNSTDIGAHGDPEEAEVESYAAGLFAIFSRFNHACCPNLRSMFYGSTMVVLAKRNIKKGEQCFYEYVGNYMTESRENRQESAEHQRFFKCECQACREHWPEVRKFPDRHNPLSFDFLFGPSKRTWKFNPKVYKELKNIHLMARTGSVSDELIWKKIFEVYEKLEPEPSVSYGFLDLSMDYLYRSCNQLVPF